MTGFEAARARADELQANVDEIAAKLGGFDHLRSAMGLLPDEIRTSAKYVALKREYSIAFEQLRNFNAWYVHNYKKEIREARTVLSRARGEQS